MNLKQYIKMAFQNLILPALYRIHSRGAVTPGLIVFADAHHDSRPDNMELLVRAGQARGGLEIRELYLDYQKNPPGRVLRAMADFMKLYARAEYVVICDNFLPAASCKKRSRTRVLQLWHACGSLKRFGYDTDDDIPRNYRGNVFRNTDLVTVSAPCCVPHFASAMRLPAERVQALGVSRTDRYFDPAWRVRARERFAKAYPEAAGKKIALWAPTFRGHPGSPELIDLDTAALERELGEDWRVITSVHPHLLRGEAAVTTEELFVSADCLIADYSSLLFEYLLVAELLEQGQRQGPEKRLVLYIPDYEKYTARRGFYMDYDEIPGIRARSFKELVEAVRDDLRPDSTPVRDKAGRTGYTGLADHTGVETAANGTDNGSAAAAQACSIRQTGMSRRAFLDKYMSACDGHATGRILDALLGER